MSKENLEKALTESVTKITGWIESAGEFAAKEAPDVARQFLEYEFYSTAMWLGLWLVLFISGICGIVGALRYEEKNKGEDASGLGVVGIIICVISAVIFLKCADDLIKIKVAPKIVILEKLREITR